MPNPNVKYTITAEDKSRRTVENVETRLKNAAKVGAAALATAAGAAVTGIAALSVKAAQAADNVGRLSVQLGISVKSLSELDYVAGQTGVRFDTLAMALQRSTRRIAEAAQGTGEARGALEELGLSAQKLNQLDPAAQFQVLAQQLSQVTNEADQVRLAFKLFDSEGVRLLRTIKATGGEFDALNDRARQLGAVIDDDLVKKGTDITKSMTDIKTALSGVANSVLATFGPALVAGANTLVEFINKARQAAEAIGLLDRRYSQLTIKELNAQWKENNRTLIEHERALKRIEDAGGTDASRKQIIADLEAENQNIRDQISLLREQAPEIEKVKLLQSGAVTGSGSPAAPTQLSQENSEAEFQRYLESLLSEEEALRLSYERRIALIEENTKTGSELQASLKAQEYARLENDLQAHQARLGNIEAQGAIKRREFEKKTAKQKTAFVINELANMTAGVAQHSKTMFRINKIAAIANAIINTAQGVTMALASYPPPLSFAMAAAQAAAGFAQVNAIKNTQYGGGGGGTSPSVSGSTPTVNDVPVDTVSTAPVIENIAPARDSVINISFNPGITDTEAVRTFITEDLSEALRDGAGLDVRVVAQ